MTIRDLLEYHGVLNNPFSVEDAQNDTIFKGSCINTSFHSAWDKIYGDPAEPSTSIVFGERGAGKTALRFQIIQKISEYNSNHPNANVLVIDYSDLNPFIDRFQQRFSHGRKIQKILARWELRDHLDAILSLGVTQLIDRILDSGRQQHPAAIDTKPLPVQNLNKFQIRDLLLLASCYDNSRNETPLNRWIRLAKSLRYSTLISRIKDMWEFGIGVVCTVVFVCLLYKFSGGFGFFLNQWFYFVVVLFWTLFLHKTTTRFLKAWSIKRSLRVLPHLKSDLLKILLRLKKTDFNGMPFPVDSGTDHRYQMLDKLLDVGNALGLKGLIVIVDRIDEPHWINGSPELMKLVIWQILDNKLLKHESVGLKLLLPDQLLTYMEKENYEFLQRARIDKQNLVRSLEWSGESLFDLLNSRIAACAADGKSPKITDFFSPNIDRNKLINAFAKLRVPRHLFKFLYKLFAQHVHSYSESEPVWQIPENTFETELALYLRNREAAEKNLGIL
ncbi:MAG: hypothetical protein LBH59_04260 [Planctomycetaceae bacterium]|jgi:hypothetical protein|nr:hypothetical protein [Planctomycetaceae bacterium]